MDEVLPAVSKRSYQLVVAALLAAAASCQRSSEAAPVRVSIADSVRAAEARRDSIVRARPGYVIDSVLPAEEELRRFRVGLTRTPTELSGGAASREALLARFASAVKRRDTTTLRELRIDRAEYAYLIYPGSQYTRPPYRQSPQIAWLLLSAASDKGLHRVVERYGGSDLPVSSARCDASPRHDGGVKYWSGCRLLVRNGSGENRWVRLFGSVAERNGRFKFASYENDL
jgi:hypothetical protein